MNNSWSSEKIKSVMAQRASGFYVCDDTRDEAIVAWKDMDDDDLGITLNHNRCGFEKLNKKEFLLNIANWKFRKCEILDCNIKELELADKTKVWCFVVSAPKYDGYCPLGLAHGLLVSGFCYFVKRRETIDWVKDVMTVKITLSDNRKLKQRKAKKN